MRGPCLAIDTACSSSLVAMGQAHRTLVSRDGRQLKSTADADIDMALVMGLCLDDGLPTFIAYCQAQMLSSRGRSFTFDESANGFLRGEGCSGVFVRRSGRDEDAQAMLACLVGTNVNQDGRSASMTAPNGPAQQMCIKASLKEACVDPHEITTSECHGTGTSLGDPIEVGSLRGVQETDNRDNALLCTSSKSNIGHLEADAGVTGLFKCILMGKYALAPPNCHLRTLNPHLDINGWPAIFENDMCDYSQNSGIAGVSSFGVSGTNAHAEVWAQCRFGPNATQRNVSVDPERLDFVKTICPITLGPIDYLTGEPVATRARVGPNGERLKVRADVLRAELADYDISSYVYSGSYRYRREELEDAGEELDAGLSLHVCGSWTGWRKMQEMELQEDGSYMCTVVTGETRAEQFFLCLNENLQYRIYPACNNANQDIWVCGPDGNGEGKRWIIDGRDEEVPAGTVYQIRLWWGWERRRVSWEEVSPQHAELAVKAQHTYSVMASWTSNDVKPMTQDPEEAGIYECTFRMGPSGQEDFALVRDGDMQQVIYPARHKCQDTTVPVCGPDPFAGSKRWLVRAPVDEVLKIRLEVDDGRSTVTVVSDVTGERTWESKEGWARHDYCIAGSWSAWECEPMLLDPESPGVFRYRGVVGQNLAESFSGFAEYFKIVMDGDFDITYYPEAACASSGECIVRGPDSDGADKPWMIKSYEMGATFEVVLNTRATDKRKMVTWTFHDAGSLSLEADPMPALPAPTEA